jgi:histidinol-phosphate aminotransferase
LDFSKPYRTLNAKEALIISANFLSSQLDGMISTGFQLKGLAMKFQKNFSRQVLEKLEVYPEREALSPTIIKLDANENPYGPSPRVFHAITEEFRLLHRYPSKPKELMEALAKYASVRPENIILGNGSDEILDMLLKAFVEPGEEVIVSTPSFQIFQKAAMTASAKVKAVRMQEDWRWNIEGILEAITPLTKLIYLCSPNNPTGSVLSEGEILKLMEAPCLLVLDEAYWEFSGKSFVGLIRDAGNLIVVRTFSKAFGLAGLRIGYAIADSKIIDSLMKVKFPFSVNRIAIAAAKAALEDIGYMERITGLIRKERKRLYEELMGIPNIKPYPSHGNFILLDVSKTGLNSGTITQELFNRGILVRNLSDLGGFKGSFIRVTVGKPEENDLFLGSLREIIEGLGERRL